MANRKLIHVDILRADHARIEKLRRPWEPVYVVVARLLDIAEGKKT